MKDAADLLGVSEMTVRRDVANCENIFTYMGGYITLKSPAAGGLGYILDRERGSHTDLKRTACQIGRALCQTGDTIFLDCGTTIPYLANALQENRDITAICYSINVAEILCKKPGLRVILLAGCITRLRHPLPIATA